jgi:CO dehydrogenase maturation factor
MSETPLNHAIRSARVARRWTQTELAERVGVHQSAVSLWETGSEVPTIEHAILLALAMPELVESFAGRERELLQRVLRLERSLFAGRCACSDCTCGDTQAIPSNAVAEAAPSAHNGQKQEERQMRIAVSGKGGVGKSTIAGTLARVLARQQQRVLAIDNDSNPNLALSLGVGGELLAQAAPIPHGLTEWRENTDGKHYVHLNKPVSAFIADHAVAAPDGVQLMVMGEVLKASVGCRCSAHAVARGVTGHLVSEADAAILDMEAGLEHLGRGTTEHVDMLLIVVDPYYRALETASRIQKLASALGIPQIAVVANRVRTPAEAEAVATYCRNHQLELLAVVPYDEAILAAEMAAAAPLDHAPASPAVHAIAGLATVLHARLG